MAAFVHGRLAPLPAGPQPRPQAFQAGYLHTPAHVRRLHTPQASARSQQGGDDEDEPVDIDRLARMLSQEAAKLRTDAFQGEQFEGPASTSDPAADLCLDVDPLNAAMVVERGRGGTGGGGQY